MSFPTKHYLLIGDCTKATEILNLPAIDLLVTSPPYFNAPFDYDELFENYEAFLHMMNKFADLYFKALKPGGIIGLNIDDMLIKSVKYPIISDTIKIFFNTGYILRGKIVWRKPEGYIRISRRSGVLLQNPYPMYYYPDNLLENILIFQKPSPLKLTKDEINSYQDIWEITNVLPLKGRLETNIAAFPDELPSKLIKIFTQKGAWICDPFLGSGTTMKVARQLKRNSIGVEILEELIPVIREKSGFSIKNLDNFFDSDPISDDILQLEKIRIKSNNQREKTNYSFLPQALNEYKPINNYNYHLLVLNCRNIPNTALNEKFSKLIDNLFPGRILAVMHDSLDNSVSNLSLNKLTDHVMKHGLRLRDKITIQHQPEAQWEVISQFKSKIVFDHCFYEVLLFQKGKFNYKSKSKQEKEDCAIDKEKFQQEKWYLTLWDFRDRSREECDSIVLTRLLELFLFNNEVVGTNIEDISCPKRQFTTKYSNLI
ncbi:MAG: site-specific DNA-methyltransferase [Candidatus Heimdallarchaeota archaeon]|nr:MAG: site-specific DNA-methyltransferase [Candidatus Heimdallarchaeota archaeon]